MTAFRAVEKLAVGRGPNDVEFELLTRIFDGPEPGQFADTIERAVESDALIEDPGWSRRPRPRRPRKDSFLDLLKRSVVPQPPFIGGY